MKYIELVAKQASEKGMQDAFKLGIPVTRQQGDKIVKIFPDGHTEFVKIIEHESVMPEKRKYYLR